MNNFFKEAIDKWAFVWYIVSMKNEKNIISRTHDENFGTITIYSMPDYSGGTVTVHEIETLDGDIKSTVIS